jgi:2-methylisocitrate lyase-like PEP mutase family enzyme
MYYILEKQYDSHYCPCMANDEFPSLQAAEKKLEALKELEPTHEFFIVTRAQA